VVAKKVPVRALIVMALAMVIIISAGNAHAESYRHQRTGLVFPDPVNALKLVRATDYEPLYAGLGTGISYRTDTMRADIFLYDLTQGPIPDGVSSQVVSKEFDQALQDIYSLETQGTYRNVSVVVKKQVTPIGDRLKFFHGVLAYEQNNIKLISHLYLTGCRGLFMKLRITYFKDAKVREEPNLAAFLAMIADITKTSSQP
jgi:hypothetical protein